MSTTIEIERKRKRLPRWIKITSTIIIAIVLLVSGSGLYLTKKIITYYKR